MEERNPMEDKARIVGLDLSKKTFVGCNLTGERFEKRSFFNGRMDEAGREKKKANTKATIKHVNVDEGLFLLLSLFMN